MPASPTPKEPRPLVPPPVRALRRCSRCAQLSQDCTKVPGGYACPACVKPGEASR